MAKDSTRVNYLSTAALTASTVKKWILLLVGGSQTAFFGLGLVLIFTGQIGWDSLAVCVMVLIPSALLLWLGIWQAGYMKTARRYNRVFQIAEGDVITLKELSVQMGRPEEKVSKDMEMLISKGFFKDCRLRRGIQAAVLLPNTEGWPDQPSFVSLKCPNCGATATLRQGERGRCEYCGSSLAAGDDRR